MRLRHWRVRRAKLEPTTGIGLLRARVERPYCRRAAEQRDKLAPPHSITSSARASSVGGTSRPSAFAVLRLMTSSNLVGCCDRQIGRLLALQDATHIGTPCWWAASRDRGAVAHETAGHGNCWRSAIECRQPVTCREIDQQLSASTVRNASRPDARTALGCRACERPHRSAFSIPELSAPPGRCRGCPDVCAAASSILMRSVVGFKRDWDSPAPRSSTPLGTTSCPVIPDRFGSERSRR